MQVNAPPFSCTHTREMPELLAGLDCSLAISTYQAGKVILIGSDGEQLSQLPRTFDNPMGMAVDGQRLAIATRNEIVLLANDPRLATSYPNKPGHYDAMFAPRSVQFCGQLNVHDMFWGSEGLVGVNTLFSCLFRLDADYSFVPLWKPPFISSLASEDRCHLNGLAMVDGRPRYASALGRTDEVQGWRPDKLNGGVLMDVERDEIVLEGLPMPHSPRVYDGKLYLLLSATGELVEVDAEAGSYEVVNRVDGFVRGMVKQGDYLFIGSSHLRKTHTFGDLALAQEGATFCGVAVIHLPTGSRVGQIQYVNSCEEIYDVQVLPGFRCPGILGIDSPVFRRALSIPETTFWGKVEQEEKRGGPQQVQMERDGEDTGPGGYAAPETH